MVLKYLTLLCACLSLSPNLYAPQAPTFHNLYLDTIVRDTVEYLNCTRRVGETWGESLCKGRPLLHTTHTTEKRTKLGNKEQPRH